MDKSVDLMPESTKQNYASDDNADIMAIDLSHYEAHDEGPARFHKHSSDEYYILPSYPEKVVLEVTINGKSSRIESPACVHIPAGSMHNIRTIKAKDNQFIIRVYRQHKEICREGVCG